MCVHGYACRYCTEAHDNARPKVVRSSHSGRPACKHGIRGRGEKEKRLHNFSTSLPVNTDRTPHFRGRGISTTASKQATGVDRLNSACHAYDLRLRGGLKHFRKAAASGTFSYKETCPREVSTRRRQASRAPARRQRCNPPRPPWRAATFLRLTVSRPMVRSNAELGFGHVASCLYFRALLFSAIVAVFRQSPPFQRRFRWERCCILLRI